MKKYLIALFFITTSYSQTDYQFDYLLEYNFTHHLDSSKSKKVFYLTNSKDNSAFVEITEKDSLHYRLIFFKHDQLYSDILVLKKGFNKAEIINIDCINIKPVSNNYKFQVENYDYIKVNDSINFETYKIICLRSEKYIKRKKIGSNIIKFNSDLPFHLPNLYHITFYEEWKKERDLPNNFFTENSFYDYKNKLIWTESLINYSKTNTKIKIITTECGELYLERILN